MTNIPRVMPCREIHKTDEEVGAAIMAAVISSPSLACQFATGVSVNESSPGNHQHMVWLGLVSKITHDKLNIGINLVS